MDAICVSHKLGAADIKSRQAPEKMGQNQPVCRRRRRDNGALRLLDSVIFWWQRLWEEPLEHLQNHQDLPNAIRFI